MTSPGAAGGGPNERARPAASAGETRELRLHVTGRSPTSVRALANLERVCTHWLPGRYRVDVIDLLENPRLAAYDQMLAVPTLIKMHPPPVRSFVGDFSDTERLLDVLQLRPGPARLTDERG